MATPIEPARERREANEKIGSLAFVKKHKWWLVAGLGIGLVVFWYMRRQQQNNPAQPASATPAAGNASITAIDPNTGVPYAQELAAAQQAASTQVPAAATTAPVDTSGGTPATAPASTPIQGPAGPAGPPGPAGPRGPAGPAGKPGTPPASKQPPKKTAPKPVTLPKQIQVFANQPQPKPAPQPSIGWWSFLPIPFATTLTPVTPKPPTKRLG